MAFRNAVRIHGGSDWHEPPIENWCVRPVRHLGVVQPAGMDDNFDVFSLLTTDEEHRNTELDVVNGYQQAWQEFSVGNWQHAKKLLTPLAGHDPPSSFLLNYLELTGPTAPSEGNCVIRLENKK